MHLSLFEHRLLLSYWLGMCATAHGGVSFFRIEKVVVSLDSASADALHLQTREDCHARIGKVVTCIWISDIALDAAALRVQKRFGAAADGTEFCSTVLAACVHSTQMERNIQSTALFIVSQVRVVALPTAMRIMQGGTSIHRSAMFPTARCVLPVNPGPRAAAPFRRRAPALTAVSARPRRGGGRRERSWDDDGGGSGDEDAVDESFFGEPRDEEEPVEPEEPSGRRRPAASPEPPAGQLRGSDVLRALQRAAAAKMEAKKKTKRSAGARPAARRREKGASGGGGVKAVDVAGEVRPIEIRREWAPRIRELELRVQQLLDKQHQ